MREIHPPLPPGRRVLLSSIRSSCRGNNPASQGHARGRRPRRNIAKTLGYRRLEQEGRDAACFRRQLQPPTGDQADGIDFADHQCRLPAAQAFFHDPKQILFFSRFDKDDLLGVNPKRDKTRPIDAARFMARAAAP